MIFLKMTNKLLGKGTLPLYQNQSELKQSLINMAGGNESYVFLLLFLKLISTPARQNS